MAKSCQKFLHIQRDIGAAKDTEFRNIHTYIHIYIYITWYYMHTYVYIRYICIYSKQFMTLSQLSGELPFSVILTKPQQLNSSLQVHPVWQPVFWSLEDDPLAGNDDRYQSPAPVFWPKGHCWDDLHLYSTQNWRLKKEKHWGVLLYLSLLIDDSTSVYIYVLYVFYVFSDIHPKFGMVSEWMVYL